MLSRLIKSLEMNENNYQYKGSLSRTKFAGIVNDFRLGQLKCIFLR